MLYAIVSAVNPDGRTKQVARSRLNCCVVSHPWPPDGLSFLKWHCTNVDGLVFRTGTPNDRYMMSVNVLPLSASSRLSLGGYQS
jgi:hypothetical protein